MKSVAVICVIFCSAVIAQRSPYAGSRPEGSFSANRLGADDSTTQGYQNSNGIYPQSQQPQQFQSQQPQQFQPVPQGVPIEFRGDVGYYNYLQTLPFEQRPFGLLNAQHIAAHRMNPNIQNSPFAHDSHYAGRRR